MIFFCHDCNYLRDAMMICISFLRGLFLTPVSLARGVTGEPGALLMWMQASTNHGVLVSWQLQLNIRLWKVYAINVPRHSIENFESITNTAKHSCASGVTIQDFRAIAPKLANIRLEAECGFPGLVDALVRGSPAFSTCIITTAIKCRTLCLRSIVPILSPFAGTRLVSSRCPQVSECFQNIISRRMLTIETAAEQSFA
jgi:hypothetical protein